MHTTYTFKKNGKAYSAKANNRFEAQDQIELTFDPTTLEDLESRWSKVLTFGDKILLAGHYYNGMGKPSYFGATYEFLTDDTSCEGAIGLREASEVEFEDDGHAIAWAMQQK